MEQEWPHVERRKAPRETDRLEVAKRRLEDALATARWLRLQLGDDTLLPEGNTSPEQSPTRPRAESTPPRRGDDVA